MKFLLNHQFLVIRYYLALRLLTSLIQTVIIGLGGGWLYFVIFDLTSVGQFVDLPVFWIYRQSLEFDTMMHLFVKFSIIKLLSRMRFRLGHLFLVNMYFLRLRLWSRIRSLFRVLLMQTLSRPCGNRLVDFFSTSLGRTSFQARKLVRRLDRYFFDCVAAVLDSIVFIYLLAF